jgi:Holliday junction resolvase RusA-like endonuclease
VELKLIVPMPPSVNQLFANVPKRGRVATKRYTAWRTEAGLRLNVQRPPRIEGPVELQYSIGSDTRADLGNTEKALTDLLVSANIIEGDSKKTVKKISLWWGDHTGVQITIRRAA